MNIISSRRALQALSKKIATLERNRRKAKDTIRWDKKNSTKLAVAKRMRSSLTASLLEALQEQGQFSHDDLDGARAKANQNG